MSAIQFCRHDNAVTIAPFGIGSILGSFVCRSFQQSLSNEATVRIVSMVVACGAIRIAANLGLAVTGVALLAAEAGIAIGTGVFGLMAQVRGVSVALVSAALFQMLAVLIGCRWPLRHDAG